MKVLKTEEFKSEVLEAQVPVLVDFYAEWCGPCKMLAPTLEKVATAVEGKAKVVKVDIDQSNELAAEFGIMSVPTMICFKNGEPVFKKIGVQQGSDLIAAIESVM